MVTSIHVVMFKYVEGLTGDEKLEISRRFLALKELCVLETTGLPYILSFNAGKNIATEGDDTSIEVSNSCLRRHDHRPIVRLP